MIVFVLTLCFLASPRSSLEKFSKVLFALISRGNLKEVDLPQANRRLLTLIDFEPARKKIFLGSGVFDLFSIQATFFLQFFFSHTGQFLLQKFQLLTHCLPTHYHCGVCEGPFYTNNYVCATSIQLNALYYFVTKTGRSDVINFQF